MTGAQKSPGPDAAVSFFVPGEPKPGGSKKAFASRQTGKIVVMEDCKGNAPWRQAVAWAARSVWRGRPPMKGPLRFEMTFFRRRPKNHFRTKGGERTAELLPWAKAARPTTKPDATKLVRAAEDALTGILWRDDAQVVEQVARKEFAGGNGKVGALILVERLGGRPFP